MTVPGFPQFGSQGGGALFEAPDKYASLADGLKFSKQLVRWFSLLRDAVNGLSGAFRDFVALENLGADIPATNFANANEPGSYRVSYYAVTTKVDAAAGVMEIFVKYADPSGITNADNAQYVGLTALGSKVNGVFTIRTTGGGITYETSHIGAYFNAKCALYLTLEKLP